jgi:hypothetical protein
MRRAQCHSSRVCTPLIGWHRKLRPYTEGIPLNFADWVAKDFTDPWDNSTAVLWQPHPPAACVEHFTQLYGPGHAWYCGTVRCPFSDRTLHSRMPFLSYTPLLLLKPCVCPMSFLSSVYEYGLLPSPPLPPQCHNAEGAQHIPLCDVTAVCVGSNV